LRRTQRATSAPDAPFVPLVPGGPCGPVTALNGYLDGNGARGYELSGRDMQPNTHEKPDHLRIFFRFEVDKNNASCSYSDIS
jgi:hypothetical protein